VAEVAGMQGDVVALRDVFEFRQTGVEDGRITGYYTATGHVPAFLDRIRAAGVELGEGFFAPQVEC
ncbi:MAG: CpaF family protein, partial [Chloroflexi bacterium]|nr:CpaF family protein [Chloroflexota bacterium]